MQTERFEMWDYQPSGWDWKGESAAFVSCLESNDEVYIDFFGSNMMGHCCRLLALTRESVGKIDFLWGEAIIDGKMKTKIVVTVRSVKKQKESIG